MYSRGASLLCKVVRHADMGGAAVAVRLSTASSPAIASAFRPSFADLPPPLTAQLPVVPPPSRDFTIPVPAIRDLPTIHRTPVSEPVPSTGRVIPVRATRLIVIKRRKLKKHFRLKRYRKRWHYFMMRQKRKKEKAETLFRERMNAIMAEAANFNAKAYVENILNRSRWTPDALYKPTGEKVAPAWHDVMSVEELYKIPPSDRIDRRALLPDAEDSEQIDKLRRSYYEELRMLKEKTRKK